MGLARVYCLLAEVEFNFSLQQIYCGKATIVGLIDF